MGKLFKGGQYRLGKGFDQGHYSREDINQGNAVSNLTKNKILWGFESLKVCLKIRYHLKFHLGLLSTYKLMSTFFAGTFESVLYFTVKSSLGSV